MLRVRAAQMENSSRLQQTEKLAADKVVALDVFDRLEANDLVERIVQLAQIVEVELPEIQAPRIGLAMADEKVAGLIHLPLLEIEGQHFGARLVGQPREKSVPAPGIEHAPGPRLPELDQRAAGDDMQIQAGVDQFTHSVFHCRLHVIVAHRTAARTACR